MDTIETLDQELNSFSQDLAQVEGQLIAQVDTLAAEIPEIYSGYASMVRTLVDSAMRMIKPNNRTANKVAIALEIGTRSIQAYGEYKAAKEHNRLLTKYMNVKKQIASNNLEKVTHLLPKAQRNAENTGRLLKKCSEQNYSLEQLDESRIRKVAALQIRALTMYRTNLYLLELAKYLKNEYGIWLTGKQRSEFDMPDYYLINSILANELYGKDLFNAYSDAADAENKLSGKQIMLLSDYQMTLMALGRELCKANMDDAHPCVRQLIEDCGAVNEYERITAPVREHAAFKPEWIIIVMGILAIAGIISIVLFYFEGSDVAKWLLAIAGSAAAVRICMKGMRNCKINYARQGEMLGENMDRDIQSMCGKVDRPDIDYNERGLLTSTIRGFFN